MARPHLMVAVLLIAAGVAARAWKVPRGVLWVDEAESCVNALTILEEGVPGNHYLGQPIFENTLIHPWPESAEYEFHDSSYSLRGFAYYHSWLPFYAIAGAMRICGIAPDAVADPPAVRHDAEEILRRTVIPRLPALLFSALFLFLIWRLGQALGGPELGLVALAVAAFSERLIWLGYQARYYSATLALTAATALALWNAARKGRWRDALLLALCAVLLFHTHTFSFLVLALVGVGFLPSLLRHGQGARKLGLLAALVVAGTLPWMVATGFLDDNGPIPRAFPLLDLPRDFLLWRLATPADIVVIAAAALVMTTALLLRRRSSPLFARGPLLFTVAWATLATVAFPLLVPAVAYFGRRAVMVTAIPAILGVGLVFVTLARTWCGRFAPVALVLATALYLGAAGNFGPEETTEETARDQTADLAQGIEALRTCSFTPGTRIYATPNDHLTLTWYTGLAVQSVAPVRRAFLDACPGDVVFIEPSHHYSLLSVEQIKAVAEQVGAPLAAADAERWRARLNALHVRRDLEGRVARAYPELPARTQLEEALCARQSEVTRHRVQQMMDSIPLLRGVAAQRWSDWWKAYAWRFVGVEERSRPEQLNIATRIHGATALVLSTEWVIYDCSRPGRSLISEELVGKVAGFERASPPH